MRITYCDLFKNGQEGKSLDNFESNLSMEERQFFDDCFENPKRSLQAIKQGKIDVNLQDDDGCTALFYFLGQEDLVGARRLIAMGIDPNLQNSLGETVLHYVVLWSEDLKLIKEMITKWKVDPCIEDNNGRTAFHLAQKYSESDIINYLGRFQE